MILQLIILRFLDLDVMSSLPSGGALRILNAMLRCFTGAIPEYA